MILCREILPELVQICFVIKINSMKILELKQINHSVKIGDICEYIEPNILEDCIFYYEGEPVGFYMTKMPEKMCKLADLANAELRSNNVPKTMMDRKRPLNGGGYLVVSQYSTIIGSIPPKPHMKRPYASISSVHQVQTAQTFIKAMTDLKRYNNISDNGSMEETLEAIVGHWPDLLLVSESELAEQIKNALTIAEATNFDDDTCFFMAEAILRTAHNAYTDRVKKIAHLAGYNRDVTSECKTCEDAYREFSHVSQKLFDQIDENHNNELVIFGDLYNALHEVYRIASHNGDQATTIEVSDFMRECYSIINNTSLPNMELAEAIANYLADILESSEEGGEEAAK